MLSRVWPSPCREKYFDESGMNAKSAAQSAFTTRMFKDGEVSIRQKSKSSFTSSSFSFKTRWLPTSPSSSLITPLKLELPAITFTPFQEVAVKESFTASSSLTKTSSTVCAILFSNGIDCVEFFWSSRSTIRTLFPLIERHLARFRQLVLFPLPPFLCHSGQPRQ